MTSPHRPGNDLAVRLRTLRESGLGGQTITQGQLAEALGVTGSSISSWESKVKPTLPPDERLGAYATFFATERSVAAQPYRLLGLAELTDQERARRDNLLDELNQLRDTARGSTDRAPKSVNEVDSGFWVFPHDQNITIVCAELPDERRKKIPYASSANVDYVKSYKYSDLDALIELIGRVRALNPNNHLDIRTPLEATQDDYTTNLFVLGGVDWNALTRAVLNRVELPVRQVARDLDSDLGGFEVDEGDQLRLFKPRIAPGQDQVTLLEDVAHVYIGPNPFNSERRIAVFNGMYGRGVLGAVRALTDPRFRGRNLGYIRTRFGGVDQFSVLSRVDIVGDDVITPDWTKPTKRLHIWAEEPSEQH